jgi:polyisoprenoid-binding protein YceI
MKNIAALVLAGFAASALAAAEVYTFDPNHTRPLFQVGHMSFSTQHGRFDKAQGKVVIDTQAHQGSMELTIDAGSIDMGTDEWNRHMKSDEFFAVDRFPTISFKSNRLVFDGDKVTGADGDFTLLGVTKPLHVELTNFRCGTNAMTKAPTCGGDAHAQFNRSDFGMTKFIPLVGDEVTILVPFEATRSF